MVNALVLVEGENVSEKALTISTRGWTATVAGGSSFGTVVDLAGSSRENLDTVLRLIAETEGVTKVITLALQL